MVSLHIKIDEMSNLNVKYLNICLPDYVELQRDNVLLAVTELELRLSKILLTNLSSFDADVNQFVFVSRHSCPV